jgi:hypothetical protein
LFSKEGAPYNSRDLLVMGTGWGGLGGYPKKISNLAAPKFAAFSV